MNLLTGLLVDPDFENTFGQSGEVILDSYLES